MGAPRGNGGMRDSIVRRRAFCARAAGLVLAGWLAAPAAAQPPGKGRRPQHPPPKPPRVVAIDPGHGGVDPGAISPHGLYEKEITLATARELARQLEAGGHFRPVLTRRADVLVPLRERAARARMVHWELFPSIHSDGLPGSDLRGQSVNSLPAQASGCEARAL